MVPGRDIVQLGIAHDVVQPLRIIVNGNTVAGIGAVGGTHGHTVGIVIGNAQVLEIVGDVLDEAGTGHDAQNLLAAAGTQGGDIIFDAVRHQGVVGDIAGGVDLLALIGLHLRLGEERGAHVLAAGKEHAVNTLHHIGHIGLGEILGLDLIGIGLLEHTGLLQIGIQDLAVGVILHSGTGDLIQLHGDAAGSTNDFLESLIILGIALPGNTDDGLPGCVIHQGLKELQAGIEIAGGFLSVHQDQLGVIFGM